MVGDISITLGKGIVLRETVTIAEYCCIEELWATKHVKLPSTVISRWYVITKSVLLIRRRDLSLLSVIAEMHVITFV